MSFIYVWFCVVLIAKENKHFLNTVRALRLNKVNGLHIEVKVFREFLAFPRVVNIKQLCRKLCRYLSLSWRKLRDFLNCHIT